MNNSLVSEAKKFAEWAHRSTGQLRKYVNAPYIVHPAEVAKIASSVPSATPEMIAAAWLHDTVEDVPGVTHAIILDRFGKTVSGYVQSLTDVSRPEDGTRLVRKAIDREHTRLAAPEAKTIKLADIISNTSTIIQHDPEFAKIYLREKALLLKVLTEGDASLLETALKILSDGARELNIDIWKT